LTPLPQVALNSTSNCVHEAEDKHVLIASASTASKCLLPTYPTAYSNSQSFFVPPSKRNYQRVISQFKTIVTRVAKSEVFGLSRIPQNTRSRIAGNARSRSWIFIRIRKSNQI